MAGVGQAYMHARWPDDLALLQSIAEKARELRKEEREDLAILIRNQVMDGLGG